MTLRKPFNQWIESDIQALIDERIPESLHREYKSTIDIGGKEKNAELCKDVSAFANAYGGAIIFGLKEKAQNKQASIPVERTPISDLRLIERLEDILVDSVQPRMEFFIHDPIPSQDKDSYYYIIDVPKSRRGLHMVRPRGIYYIRRNFRVDPMDALEIEDAFRSFFAAGIDIEKRINDKTLPNPNKGLPRAFNSWLSVTTVPYFPQQDLFESLFHLSKIERGKITLGIRYQSGLDGREGFIPSFTGLNSVEKFPLESPEETGQELYYHQHRIFSEGAVHIGLHLNCVSDLPLGMVLSYLHTSFAFVAGLFDYSGYRGPLEIRVDIRGIKHLVPKIMKAGFDMRGFKKLTINNYYRRISTSGTELAENSIPVVQVIMDHLCRAGGKSKCDFYHYDKPGVFDENLVSVVQNDILRFTP